MFYNSPEILGQPLHCSFHFRLKLAGKRRYMSEDSNSRSVAGQGSTGEMSRPSNLQRIAQKKNQVRNYPRTKKLEKLAVYSSCKVSALFM